VRRRRAPFFSPTTYVRWSEQPDTLVWQNGDARCLPGIITGGPALGLGPFPPIASTRFLVVLFSGGSLIVKRDRLHLMRTSRARRESEMTISSRRSPGRRRMSVEIKYWFPGRRDVDVFTSACVSTKVSMRGGTFFGLMSHGDVSCNCVVELTVLRGAQRRGGATSPDGVGLRAPGALHPRRPFTATHLL
jgi:hypothetical protein